MPSLSKTPSDAVSTRMVYVAVLLFWLTLATFAGRLDGYVHARHPVAMLGAQGVANAAAFNALGFVLPGVVLAVVAWRWRQAMPGHGTWGGRIGMWLALLAALAFSLQGWLPLDLGDLDTMVSRLHAATWTLWWVSFMPAALMLALAGDGDRRRPILSLAGLVVGALSAWMALSPPLLLAPGIAQRLALAGWFGWWLLAATGRAGRKTF